MKFGWMFFITAAWIAVSSCKKDEQISPLDHSLQYSETQCNDPWANDLQRSDPDFLRKLDAWLEAKTGVKIPDPQVKYFPGQASACSECSCRTGYVLYVWLPRGVDQQFLALGFKK